MCERSEAIIQDAISGLVEYYACLTDEAFVDALRASLTVPDSGNDQLDYEAVRDQIERLIDAKAGEDEEG